MMSRREAHRLRSVVETLEQSSGATRMARIADRRDQLARQVDEERAAHREALARVEWQADLLVKAEAEWRRLRRVVAGLEERLEASERERAAHEARLGAALSMFGPDLLGRALEGLRRAPAPNGPGPVLQPPVPS